MADPATQDPAGARRCADALTASVARPLPGTLVLAVQGELDTLTAPELRAAVAELLAGDHARVVVDLSGVTFLASSGLAVLIQAAQQAGASGRALHLVVTGRAVLRPLEVTGSNQLFTLHPDLDTAVAG